MRERCCGTCVYSTPFESNPSSLECHVNPPVLQITRIQHTEDPGHDVNMTSYWPPTNPTAWCGRYKRTRLNYSRVTLIAVLAVEVLILIAVIAEVIRHG